MRNHAGVVLTFWMKLLVATATVVALGAAVLTGLKNTLGLAAQSSAADASSPVFEVASVKPHKSADGERSGNFGPGGRVTLTNATLRDLVQLAYQLPDGHLRHDSQISGGPGWINSDRFDVVAKAEGMPAGLDASSIPAGAARSGEIAAIDRVRLMLRKLLADRFKLAVHNETRELPVYALVVARSDGKLGAQLRKVDVDCAALREGGRPSPPHEPGKAACGGFRGLGPGRITGHALTMSMIASWFPESLGRIVLDRTGLSGVFDLDLEWTPDPSGPSIFTAVQEQLGLKLESSKGPVDVLVIESVEQPTPD